MQKKTENNEAVSKLKQCGLKALIRGSCAQKKQASI